MIHTKQVTAIRSDGKQYVWTNNSEKTLAQWKAKIKDKFGDDFTFSAEQDNPETARYAQIKAQWELVADPAVKKLLKLLLKEYIDE
jgi:hypothetical protein